MPNPQDPNQNPDRTAPNRTNPGQPSIPSEEPFRQSPQKVEQDPQARK